jgi:hypothetical protein
VPIASDHAHSRRCSQGLRTTIAAALVADHDCSYRLSSWRTSIPAFHANPASGARTATPTNNHTPVANQARPRAGRHFHPASLAIDAAGGSQPAINHNAASTSNANAVTPTASSLSAKLVAKEGGVKPGPPPTPPLGGGTATGKLSSPDQLSSGPSAAWQ